MKACGRVSVKNDGNAKRLLLEIEINENSFGAEFVSWTGQYVKCGAASRILEFQRGWRIRTAGGRASASRLQEPTYS
jgi:hypothetical protein